MIDSELPWSLARLTRNPFNIFRATHWMDLCRIPSHWLTWITRGASLDHSRRLTNAASAWLCSAFYRPSRENVRESVSPNPIYGDKGPCKGRNFRIHALSGRGKTGSSSQHALYRHTMAGKGSSIGNHTPWGRGKTDFRQ